MGHISLLASSGNARVDRVLRDIIRIYETALPDRMRGYYLLGSYADSSSVGISDIDLMLVFKDRLSDAERDAAEQLEDGCARLSSIRLDLWFCGEADLMRATVPLKLGSLLVYGADIRDQVALPPLDAYTRDVMDAGGFFLRHILRGADRLVLPLDYPDPTGEFFGYDTIHIPVWYPPGTTHGIKELVTSATRVATALIAFQAGQYAGTKSGSIALYRARVGDAWSDYLDRLYANGKQRWGYAVPDDADDRQLLRRLCEQTLAFERHFFALYREHLLGLLASSERAHQLTAAARLSEIVYPGDAELAAALELLYDSRDSLLRQSATKARWQMKYAGG